MNILIQSFLRAFLDLFRPRILLLLFVPPIMAFLFWGLVAFVFWAPLLSFGEWMSSHFFNIQQLPSWTAEWLPLTPSMIATGVAGTLVVLSVLPLAFLTTLILTSLIVMPVVTRLLSKDFPTLMKRGGGINAFTSNFKNLLKTSVIYLLLWLVTLPFWFLPGMSVAIPLVLNAYLNYRLFLFDALGEYGTLEEIRGLLKTKRTDFFLMGLLTSFVFLFPLSFLIGPVYSALAFTRMGFAELLKLRSV